MSLTWSRWPCTAISCHPSVLHAACASWHGSHSPDLGRQRPAPDIDVSRALIRRAWYHPCRRSPALGSLLACMPLQHLASLTVACTGLHAEDTAGLAYARQLTALDLSCNPCLSEACLQHLHGETSCQTSAIACLQRSLLQCWQWLSWASWRGGAGSCIHCSRVSRLPFSKWQPLRQPFPESAQHCQFVELQRLQDFE